MKKKRIKKVKQVKKEGSGELKSKESGKGKVLKRKEKRV